MPMTVWHGAPQSLWTGTRRVRQTRSVRRANRATPGTNRMKNNRWTYIWLLCALAFVMLPGCSRDPNVRKQKYFDSARRYVEEKKFREAAIQFQNALQVDPRFADAHYQLAQRSRPGRDCLSRRLRRIHWPGLITTRAPTAWRSTFFWTL